MTQSQCAPVERANATPHSIAQCTCCGAVFTRAEWAANASRRPWAEFDLEIAECACGSTISVEVPT